MPQSPHCLAVPSRRPHCLSLPDRAPAGSHGVVAEVVALKMMSGTRSPVPRGQGPSCHPSAVPTGFLVGGENRSHWEVPRSPVHPYPVALTC